MPKKDKPVTVADELEIRFRDGEHLNLGQLIKEYYPHLHPLEGEQKIRARIATCKHRLAKDGIAICPVGQGVFGVPQTKQQYIYGQSWYYRQVMGLVEGARLLYQFGEQQSLIPDNFKMERLALPRIIEE